jgi:hypothetical protein
LGGTREGFKTTRREPGIDSLKNGRRVKSELTTSAGLKFVRFIPPELIQQSIAGGESQLGVPIVSPFVNKVLKAFDNPYWNNRV